MSADRVVSLADRRAAATREAIADAAWALSRERGLTGWSLRELAAAVGVKAPTLYAYVDSKQAIYDEMFRAGYAEFRERAAHWSVPQDPSAVRDAFKQIMAEFVRFCTEDTARYQLMFQRVVPDFEPSPEAYAESVAVYDLLRERMALVGVTSEADLDLWTAVSAGLTSQQISNDPGGDRWTRLVDRAVDMFCDHVGIAPANDSAVPSPHSAPGIDEQFTDNHTISGGNPR